MADVGQGSRPLFLYRHRNLRHFRQKMIPTFPHFKSIEWSDRKEVQQFTCEFPPYSDFNFVSMYSWNTREKMMLSKLNENLVVLFYDYLTEAPFLSFIGKKRLDETAIELIEYSKLRFKISALKLIPEEIAVQLSDLVFAKSLDIDSHDYIISVPLLSNLDTLPNAKCPAAPNCRKFIELYPEYYTKHQSAKEILKDDYIGLFKGWAKAKNLNHWELNEYSAFERFVSNRETDNYIVSLFNGDKMMGFVSYEIIPPNYAICHFVKADIDFKGIYEGMNFAVGKVLKEYGIDYWNFEQDMGLPGLRQSKRKYKPEFYLKKFIVEQNKN